ncbi:MAG TPA: hypothetical protein PKM34_07395 [Bacteroidales bacterium]|nr:hypothetical protein [Bacteroidales bacterium]
MFFQVAYDFNGKDNPILQSDASTGQSVGAGGVFFRRVSPSALEGFSSDA